MCAPTTGSCTTALFQQLDAALVKPYPTELLSVIQSVAPENVGRPRAVVLTPGIYNSAYFEHCFLAQHMGIELVEGRVLLVDQGFVYMKTIYGRRRVDIIYREDIHFIKVAHGCDYQDCPPIRGLVYTAGSQQTEYSVSVVAKQNEDSDNQKIMQP